MGIATRIAVRLTRNPPVVRTLLLDFTSIEDAAATVSGIIAAGIVPAALEMMDAEITRAVEDYVGAGYPRDAAAVLLVEVDGLAGGVAHQVDAGRAGRPRARRAHGPRRGRRSRARAAVEGTQVGVRRDRPHRPRLLPARRGRAAHEARRRAAPGVRDRARAAAHDDERVPRRRRQPASRSSCSTPASRECGNGCTAPATRSSPRASPPGACSRGSTASGWRSARRCR